MKRSETLFKEAKASLVGGVNSPVRAFNGVDGDPIFISHAKGPYLYSEDGQRYIDYVLSWGPLILGHAHPQVVSALTATLQKGTSFGAPTVLETELAQKIKTFFPSMEKMRFVNSGTEATMSAIRVARGVTKRDTIVKFNGCYHGHSNGLLVAAGSGSLTLGVPDSAGVLEDEAKHTLVLEYNDIDALKRCFKEKGAHIACVILEPVCGNMGVVLPEPGFIETMHALCKQYDALLIFDEVMTGFRVAKGGAQAWLQIKPDITVLGKVIGGGLPCGAYGGRADIMGVVAPEGPVYQAGTLSGNPLVMSAGIATLNALEEKNVFDEMVSKTQYLVDQMKAIIKRKQKNYVVQSIGTMFSMFFTNQKVRSLIEAKTADIDAFKRFHHQMLHHGIYMAPSPFEAGFMSIAHTQKDLKTTIEAFNKSV